MESLNKIHRAVQEVFGNEQVYSVGGCVRDTLLGHTPKDYDFCTQLDPDKIEALIKKAGRRAYLTGKRWGTLGFKVEVDGKWHFIEVTTFRKEQYQPGSRKPEVEFVSDLKEDLSRRDFTVNAIAYDGKTYIDPFSGRIDLLAKKIKAVGKSKDRFREDPLRMLRAARFAAQLGFEVDPNMIGITRQMSPLILGISRERWVNELDKLLVCESFEEGLLVLQQSYLMKYIIPELWLHFKSPQFMSDTFKQIKQCDKNPDERWAALLSDVGKVFVANYENAIDDYASMFNGHRPIGKEIATGICLRLKFSNQRKEIVLNHK